MNQSDKNTLSRRSFLTGAAATAGLAAFAGLAGCAPQSTTGGAANAATASGASASGSASAGAMQTTDPAQAVWPVVEEVEVGAAGEGTGTSASLTVNGTGHRVTGRGRVYENGKSAGTLPFTLAATCVTSRW